MKNNEMFFSLLFKSSTLGKTRNVKKFWFYRF